MSVRSRAAVALAALLAAGPARAAAPPAVPQAAFAELHWRSIGPYRAGWATAVSGVPGAPYRFYFGAAGGGLWRSDDAGLTWRALLQHAGASAVGALAVAASDARRIYVGTGQPDSRYDVASGDGIYRSDDGGGTWTHAGLADTRHVGALLVDPRDRDRVLVAALGHAFGANAERGVFLTTDAGAHWRAVLQPGDSVGAVDLASDPSAPRIVYAATWQRRLHPWFDYFAAQGGPGSGIWRSDDAGEHWTRLGGGLPAGDLGRIGLAVARGSGGRVVYAVIASAGGVRRGGAPGLYRSADGGGHWTLVNADGGLGSSYFGRLVVAPRDSDTVYLMGQSIRVSRDGGRTLDVLRGSPGGDDYHALWIDPEAPERMVAGSDQGAAVSLDGGATWSSWYNQPTGQFYRLGADDQFPYHVYSGQQDNGTVDIATRGPYGAIEERDWHPVGGDERDIMLPKPGDPDVVFGSGLGGGVSRFDARTRQSINVAPWPSSGYGAPPLSVRYRYGWLTPLAISPLPPHALYLGAQVLFRSLDDGDHWQVVSPDLSGRREGAGPCDDPGPEAARDCGFGVISAIAPSPLAAGRVWVGTDDGRVHLTRDDGGHWSDVTPPQLPAWGIVFAIDPSPLDTSVAYVAVDLHRTDRHAPLLLRTRDDGRTWTPIVGGLPADEFTSVVRCDLRRSGLLYAGTQRGVYVSFDDGGHWQPLSLDLPTTWMRDLLPHGDDLLLATQGRGLWVLDDVAPLRELSGAIAAEGAHLFAPAPAVRLRTSESHDTPWPPETPLGENPPTGALVDYWLARAGSPVTLEITDSTGALVRRFASTDTLEALDGEPYFERAWLHAGRGLPATPGMHRFVWDLRYPRPMALGYHHSIAAVRAAGTPLQPLGPLVVPGRYTVTLTAAGVTQRRTLEVRRDPRVTASDAALHRQLALALAADSTLARAVAAARAIARRRAGPPAAAGAAESDTLAAIADRGPVNLSRATGALASLVSALQAADAAPPQGLDEQIARQRADIEGLLARWRRFLAGHPGTR